MDEILTRIWENLGGRIGGPLKFRLLIQPLMVGFLAIRAGIQDARAGRPAYFWAMLSDSQHRSDLLREGWKAVAKVFTIAFLIDVIYQLIVERWVYPLESLVVAIVLAIVPYLLMRGPVTRIVRATAHAAHTSDTVGRVESDTHPRGFQ
jgi:hypothetical protein